MDKKRLVKTFIIGMIGGLLLAAGLRFGFGIDLGGFWSLIMLGGCFYGGWHLAPKLKI